ncbi:MAG: UTRA domain-containing protein [Gammaproteobacteria bacterium]|nr:UTRA domain-containing protein [Gammaproteobacteria bacterium]
MALNDPTDITARLRAMIESDFADGDRLPSEVKLSEALGVSRAKLREAFGKLWQAGLIEKKWGVGTIVRKPRDEKSLTVPLPYIRSHPALIRESGQEASVSDLSILRRPADAMISDLLDIAHDSEIWLIDRVFRADDVPVQRTFDAVPAVIEGVAFDASGFDVNTNTLIAMFHDQLDSELFRSDGRLSVVPAPGDTASLLGLREGEPVLLVEYSAYSNRGTIICYSVTWYNPARIDVRFSAERREALDFHGSIPQVAEKRVPPMRVSSHLSALKQR